MESSKPNSAHPKQTDHGKRRLRYNVPTMKPSPSVEGKLHIKSNNVDKHVKHAPTQLSDRTNTKTKNAIDGASVSVKSPEGEEFGISDAEKRALEQEELERSEIGWLESLGYDFSEDADNSHLNLPWDD